MVRPFAFFDIVLVHAHIKVFNCLVCSGLPAYREYCPNKHVAIPITGMEKLRKILVHSFSVVFGLFYLGLCGVGGCGDRCDDVCVSHGVGLLGLLGFLHTEDLGGEDLHFRQLGRGVVGVR